MTLASKMGAHEVRETWESRALVAAEGKMQRILLAAIRAEIREDLLLLLLRETFGQIEIKTPFYRGHASIVPSGHLVCEVVDRDANGLVWRGTVKVYDNENRFLYEMRKLADKLKLSDEDRKDMFRVLQKWITKDERFDLNNEKRMAS